jgi:hypothetical protein
VEAKVLKERSDQQDAALIALLRTIPETLAGSLAALRYVASWARDSEAGLFEKLA